MPSPIMGLQSAQVPQSPQLGLQSSQVPQSPQPGSFPFTHGMGRKPIFALRVYVTPFVSPCVVHVAVAPVVGAFTVIPSEVPTANKAGL